MTAATKAAKPRTRAKAETRTKSEEPTRKRSVRRGGRGPMAMHDALSDDPLVPKLEALSPTLTSRRQRFLQVFARHLVRDNPWLRNLVTVATDQQMGNAPMPVSPHEPLNRAFAKWKDQIDPRGRYDWSGYWREAFREWLQTGDVFVRFRSRIDQPEEAWMHVPFQAELLQSDFVPIEYEKTVGTLKFVCGVANGPTGRPSHYAFCTEHPLERNVIRETILTANQVLHIGEFRLGAPRGEVMLASALMRAIKAATLEDAELRRKMVSSLMSVFATRPSDAVGIDDMPDEEEVSAMIDSISLTPGGFFEMPYGYKIETFAPKDEPSNFTPALKWQLMAVCAAVGVMPHDVIFDYEFPERLGRYLNLIQERRAGVVHRQWEFQAFNPLWRRFVDHCVQAGLFVPPEDPEEDYYRVHWEWDLTPLASFKQELEALQGAEEKGLISKSYIQKTMFQASPEQVDVERAREAARAKALEAIADRLLAEETAKLLAELDAVEV